MCFFFFKQKTAYEMRISDWSSDVCSSDLRESAALEAAYWSQLVGNFAWRARPAPITSYNFSAFSPFHTFPAGHEDGNHWGPAVALLKTSARSPYYFNFNSADLGHSLVIGPSGGGKTVRSEEHTSEPQSLMSNSYAVFCLTKEQIL